MFTARRVVSVILRVGELISASIVCGIMGRYLNLREDANAPYSSRLVYTVTLAAISIICSLVLLPPFKYSYMAFPFDYALFICWMVCFGLLTGVSIVQRL